MRKVLLIVVDQFRADCVQGALADAVTLPNLNALMADAVSFTQHYTVTTPCGPSRASLLTGLYAMNHRSIRNGTPLSSRHQTIGTLMRQAGMEPLLFGYTDTSADPHGKHPEDPDLKNYEGLAAGFSERVQMRLETPGPWVGYLKQQGYELPADYWDLYRPVLDPLTATDECPEGSPVRSPALYASEHSDTAFLTDRTIEALSGIEETEWFSLVTYIRPHPPLVAPEPYNRLVNPDTVPRPDCQLSPAELAQQHPFYSAYFSAPAAMGLYAGFDGNVRNLSVQRIAELRAVYLGLAVELDHHIGRLLQYLKDSGQYEDTLIVVTADHGEILGDQHQWGKCSPIDSALHIPLIIRDPTNQASFGKRVSAMTESVDIAPTILSWANGPKYPGFDGLSLLGWLGNTEPQQWRQQVFMEMEFGEPDNVTPYQLHTGLPAQQANLAVLRREKYKYVHFNGGLPPLLFDLSADPGEHVNLAGQPEYQTQCQSMAASMLDHRMTFADHALSSMKLTQSGLFVGQMFAGHSSE